MTSHWLGHNLKRCLLQENKCTNRAVFSDLSTCKCLSLLASSSVWTLGLLRKSTVSRFQAEEKERHHGKAVLPYPSRGKITAENGTDGLNLPGTEYLRKSISQLTQKVRSCHPSFHWDLVSHLSRIMYNSSLKIFPWRKRKLEYIKGQGREGIYFSY